MSGTYYRVHPAGEAPESILSEERWESRPWIGQLWKRCEDCGGHGYHEEPDDFDEHLGTARYTCESCGGEGQVEDVRCGVSCCADLEALRRYMAEHHANISGDLLIEFEGELSRDDDHDAADGALLALPRRIVSVQPVPASWLEEIAA